MSSNQLRRRQILRTIGIGAGATLLTGTASATGKATNNGGDCPECPDGTRLLAKYEFDDESGEFYFEKGACDDAVTNIVHQNKDGEENEPIKVEFSSLIYTDNAIVKYGRNCESASESDGVTFWMDEEKDSDGFEGSITLEDSRGAAISNFSLCAGVCYQVDFVFGERIEDLSQEQYGGKKIAVRWDGTAVDKGQIQDYTEVSNDGATVTNNYADQSIKLADDESEAEVSFDVVPGSEDVTLTLVSYAATCPPRFGGGGTAYIQDLYDYETVTYSTDHSGETLSVKLPGLDQLNELCDVDS